MIKSNSELVWGVMPERPGVIIVLRDSALLGIEHEIIADPTLPPEAPCRHTAVLIDRLLKVARTIERVQAFSLLPPPSAAPMVPRDEPQRAELAELLGFAWRSGRSADLREFIATLHERELVPCLNPETWTADQLRAVRLLFQATKRRNPNPDPCPSK